MIRARLHRLNRVGRAMGPAMRRLTLAAAVALCGLGAARAAAFPDKPVRMIVAFPAGGGTDIVARLIAERLTALWGQQVIVDNRGGAGGVIGTVTFDSLVQALPYIQAGKLRALAVLGDKRSALLPDVPTLSEAGLRGYNFSNWFGLVAPAGVPADRIRTLNADVRKVLDEPAVKDQLAKMGAVPAGNTPEQFGKQIRDDSAKWARVIREQDIKAQ